jgi:hypothetical protein
MAADGSERALIERVLARPVAAATQAVWGFTNRTDIVTLDSGERLELLAGETRVAPDVQRIVADRLHAMLS